LKAEPGNNEAADGLRLTGRDLRPAVTFRAGRTDDPALQRDELSATYRRWSDDRSWRLEAGVLTGRESFDSGRRSPRGLFGSLWNTRLPLSPLVEAAYYDSDVDGARLFGAVQLSPVPERLKLRVAHLDWGRTVFSPQATRDRLTADSAGVSGESGLAFGTVRGRLDLYDISDGNRIIDGEAQVTPSWQPLPWRLTWFGGVYGRRAEREDPRYWSPRPAYSIAFVGLQRHWALERADFSASLRRGISLSDTAGDSWSAGASGRIWLRQDLAVGLEGWLVDAPRPASYRMNHFGAFVQQLL